jgi:hypothetical protein
MRRAGILLTLIACGAVGGVFAMYSVADEGQWPTSWPTELEPLRKQARTLEGPLAPQLHYEIPFTQPRQFEAAWPHILKVKSPGAPIVLLRSPNASLGETMTAGVRIHGALAVADGAAQPKSPLPGEPGDVSRWLYTTWLELVVDGEIVDLNRIPLPLDTPIIDKRFEVAK